MGKIRKSRNRELAPGVNQYGRSISYHRSGRWAIKNKGKQVTEKKEEVVVKRQEPKFYAADDVKRPIQSRKSHKKPCKLRESIIPGTVLILLAGRFRGKRVVFLKQLEGGLLLVTGPYKINGVPLRRVNQRYVIATSTHVDVSKVDASKIDDAFFAKAPAAVQKKDSEEFFADEKTEKVISEERKAAQKLVDTALLAEVKAVPLLKHYLNAKFSLTNGMYPHEINF